MMVGVYNCNMTKKEKALRKEQSRREMKIREVLDLLERKEKAREYPLEIFRRRVSESSQTTAGQCREQFGR